MITRLDVTRGESQGDDLSHCSRWMLCSTFENLCQTWRKGVATVMRVVHKLVCMYVCMTACSENCCLRCGAYAGSIRAWGCTSSRTCGRLCLQWHYCLCLGRKESHRSAIPDDIVHTMPLPPLPKMGWHLQSFLTCLQTSRTFIAQSRNLKPWQQQQSQRLLCICSTSGPDNQLLCMSACTGFHAAGHRAWHAVPLLMAVCPRSC